MWNRATGTTIRLRILQAMSWRLSIPCDLLTLITFTLHLLPPRRLADYSNTFRATPIISIIVQ